MSDWDWELTDTARRDFDSLDEYARDRITSKLDEIVTDEWREPPEYLEPLEGAPHDKLRIGPFRLAVVPTVPPTFFKFSGFANAAATHIVVTTMTEYLARLFLTPNSVRRACVRDMNRFGVRPRRFPWISPVVPPDHRPDNLSRSGR